MDSNELCKSYLNSLLISLFCDWLEEPLDFRQRSYFPVHIRAISEATRQNCTRLSREQTSQDFQDFESPTS